MPPSTLTGSNFSAEDKLDKLRQQIHSTKFQENEIIRQFVNRYVSANPNEAKDKSKNVADELVGNIRSELGLAPTAQPGVTKVIADHVKDLVLGRAQSSEDTARWAVHHAANQVTMYSGQFVYDAEDIFIDGAGMDFVFRRTYKNQGFYNGPLGINWDHNYNLWLRKVDGNQKIVSLTGGFQESTYVKHELHKYWVPPPGEHSIIIDVSDMASRQEFGIQSSHNCHYGLRLSDGTVYFYEKDLGNPDPNLYRIKRIEDRFGNYLEFGYGQAAGGSGNRLEKVYINNPARVVSFEYDTLDRIISIKDYKERKKDKIKGRIWRYTYDDLGDLIAFTTPGTDHYPEGLTERYVYSTPYYNGELQHNLVKVYDTAGRMYLENEYGTDTGLLSFNRVVRQREGSGERYFEYEDISLAIGSPVGQTELEEDWPAHQTVMMRRNGHPVHYIYNKFGNLIAREEDAWTSGTRRRLITHYRYNRDGALIGEVSPEGRMTQYLYGRDEFIHAICDLTEDQLRKRNELNWKKRLSFGNRLAVVQRYEKKYAPTFQFPGPLRDIYDVATHSTKDIVVKFTYGTTFQNIESISDPRYTKSPFTGNQEDYEYKKTLTTLEYYPLNNPLNGHLKLIKYPNIVQADQSELKNIVEHFLDYDGNGRLTKYEDRAGTRMDLTYFPHSANLSEAAKEGYLKRQIIDPKNQNNPNGLNLKTQYKVNEVGVVTHIKLPKRYLFSWDEIPGNDNGKLIEFLKQKFGIDWVKKAEIEKIDNGNTIKVSTEINHLSLNLNQEKTEVIFKIDDGRTDKSIAKMENGKLNIYSKSTVVEFEVNDLNQITKVTRALKPNTKYDTRYTYCRNMRVERIERDVQDEIGQPLWGGTEVQFLHYDENDNVIREQIGSPDFGDHLITHHTYDDGDLRVGTTLPRGNRTRINYDERRLPKKIERGVGSSESVKVKVVYDGDGLLREQRDGRGLKTEFIYDNFGRVIETREYDRDENEPDVSKRDKLYRLIRQDYDKAGNLTIERLFKPDGNAYKLLYHASYGYDELNQLIENRLRRFQIPIAYTSADKEKDNDDVPLPDPLPDPLPNPLSEAVRILYFYDKAGRPIRVEQHGRRLDTNGQPQLQDTILASKYEYNSVGWLIAETDQLGNRTETRYDKHGLVTRVDVREKVSLADSPTGEEIFTTLYKYDDLDRLKSVTDGLGNTNCFEYDSRDTIICQEKPLGNITRFDYDIYGRQVAERIEMTETGLGGGARQPNSDIITQYVFDANSNLIQLIDAHNTPTHQVYDALDRRIELRFVDGTATKYKYDGNDNVVWLQDNNGLVKRTIYDLLDNPVRMDVDKNGLKPNLVVEGAMYEAFEYDALGQMTCAENDWADIHFKVDSLGRVYEESVDFYDQASVFTLKRAYDDFDFLTRLTYPNGRVLVYQPDELNRIKRIENKAYGANYPGDTNLPQQRMILENTYRGLRIDRKSYGNGASAEYAYDGAGRIINISHRDAQNAELLTIQHLYDAAGNMRFKREFAPNDNYGEVYKYNSRSQLTLFQDIQPSPTNTDRLNLKELSPVTSILAENQYKGQSQVINPILGSLAQVHNQFTFKYDKLGNRLEERSPNQPQPITYTPNNLNQYTQRNNKQFDYDPSGNLRQEKTGATARDYIYNHRNQIVRVNEGGNLARFRYDAFDRCIWEDIEGTITHFLYVDDNVIEEWKGMAPQLSAQYVNEFEIDDRCQLASSANESWYHKDLIGSTRLLTNINGTNVIGNELAFYRFTPFGVWNLPVQLPSLSNDYLFAGRRFIGKIDCYDFRARHYSPINGCFLQRDAEGYKDVVNLYEYVRNNPPTLIDRDGLAPQIATIPPEHQKAYMGYLESRLAEFDRQTAAMSRWQSFWDRGRSMARRILVANIREYKKGLGLAKKGEHIVPVPDPPLLNVFPSKAVDIMPGLKLSFNEYVPASPETLGALNWYANLQAKVGIMESVTAILGGFAGVAARAKVKSQIRNHPPTAGIELPRPAIIETYLSNKPLTPIAPPIALGEIKGLRSYRHGLRQLSKREDIAGNTALATYDYSGQVNLQVFAVDAFGVRKIIWNGYIGRVTNLPRLRPGTTPFGNEMEPKVRRLVERATGQKYKTKAGNAPGPDILPKKGH